jgi:DNA-binding HxlR family transcriptional regulator/putative sterol carrier protein
MAKRSYDQYCGLAAALDVIGERWSLLVVRELLLGARRFTELVEGLPGIPRNLLARRLKELEAQGVVRHRVLDSPVRSAAWELTERGRRLEPLVVEGARWGAQLLGERPEPEAIRPGWFVVSLRARFRREQASEREETYELRIDDEPFTVRVGEEGVETVAGHSEHPDLVMTTTKKGFLDLLAGRLSPEQAVSSGVVRLAGERATFKRFVALFAGGGAESPAAAANARS